MVGDLEKSSFSNIEQPSLEFVKYTLDPWVIRWEQALKKSLFLPEEKKEFFIKLNVDGLLRGDYQSRMNGYAIGRQNGWLSTNDIREMEDMNPLPEAEGGNLYLVQGLKITEQTVVDEVIQNGKKHYCYTSKADFDCGIRNSASSTETENGSVLPSVNRPRRTVIKL